MIEKMKYYNAQARDKKMMEEVDNPAILVYLSIWLLVRYEYYGAKEKITGSLVLQMAFIRGLALKQKRRVNNLPVPLSSFWSKAKIYDLCSEVIDDILQYRVS